MEDEQISSNINPAKSELGNLSVRDIFYKYVRFLPLFLLSLAVALLIAWVYLRYATRIYGAGGTMLIKNEQPKNNDKVEDIISGNNRTQNIMSEIEVLKSKPLMLRVVNKLHLQFSYTAIGKIIEQNVYKQGPFIVNAYSIADSSASFSFNVKLVNNNQFRINNESTTYTFEQQFQRPFGVFSLSKNYTIAPGSEYRVDWQPADGLSGFYANAVKVQPKTPGTGILSVTLQATNAQLAADIINHLMVEYDSLTVEQNNYSTDQMLSFIDERLRILDHELDSIQVILLSYQQKNNLIDAEAQSGTSFEKMNEFDKAINEQRLKLNVAEMVDDYLKDKKNQFAKVVVPSSLGIEDPTLNELVSGYNKAQLERQSLLDGNVPPNNPIVKEAEGQIEKLRESTLENLKNIKSSYVSLIDNLEQRNKTEQKQFESLPFKLKEYVEIKRQVSTKEALKTLLETKREEAAITRASTLSNSKVIDMAIVSNSPVKPNKRTIQLFAVLIGIGLPALLIFVGEVINDKITTRFDIEKITAAPVLGEVGHSYSEATMLVNKTNRSMVAEQSRIIRSNLQYVLPKNEKPVVLVTSSVSGEGKSFVSINMGAVLALTGKKTIILEFDIRKPKVLSGLKMSKRSGISNYLLGKGELPDFIVPVPDMENLYVLPCGPVPPNPSELLLDPKVKDMFRWLRENFDAVFIDTAPVGMVSDAMTLGKFADSTLYLVRQGHTFKKQVTLIDEFYQQKKLPKVSIVINDVKVKPGYGYYGYGRYGYGYGYGYGQRKGTSYYDEEKPPKSSFEKFINKLNPMKWFGRS
jgi:tyrosine-protein kinase Etk/Wzc